MQEIIGEKGLELAAYQPKFLLDQVVSSCRFMEEPVGLNARFLKYAIDNLRVKRAPPVPKISPSNWQTLESPAVQHSVA